MWCCEYVIWQRYHSGHMVINDGNMKMIAPYCVAKAICVNIIGMQYFIIVQSLHAPGSRPGHRKINFDSAQ